jgi:cell division transport system permease protein
VGALGRLRAGRGASIMTAAVIGIALALPAAFLTVLDNLQSITGDVGTGTRASLFLRLDSGPDQWQALAERLRAREDVTGVTLITPDQALMEFRAHSGLGDAVELLQENPLPAVLVVEPMPALSPAAVDRLVAGLHDEPLVEQLRLDREWLKRLHAIMQLAQRGVWVIALLLALTVVLVVGNTIRLDIQNRRDEIVIMKLIGGTDAFVRRPFLYTGLWYGIIGGLLSCLLVESGRLLLAGPVAELARLYDSAFRLAGVGFSGGVTLLMAGTLLGLLGSWLAVGRHLAAIEPR